MVRGFVGVIHLPAMPGDPRCDLTQRGSEGFRSVEAWAERDAEALVMGGVDALIVENFGSTPFSKGSSGHRLPPHHVAAMAILCRRLRERHDVPIGVNCLRNDARSALGIAAAADLGFVRVNVHCGAYATDQGIIEGEADQSLRYRQQLSAADVAILADVLVKHAQPITPVDATTATHDCLHRGLADGVIVTGAATGAPISRELLQEIRTAAERAPVFLGSGVTPDNAADLAPLAEGAIVGSWLKKDGRLYNPVDVDRVRTMANAVRGRFR